MTPRNLSRSRLRVMFASAAAATLLSAGGLAGCDDENTAEVEDVVLVDTSMGDGGMDTADPDGVDPDVVDPDMVDPDTVDPDMVDPDTIDPCDSVANPCDTPESSCDGDSVSLCAADANGCLVVQTVDCAAAGGTCDDSGDSAVCAGVDTEVLCNDGLDDDGDGDVDCDDADCDGAAVCVVAEVCDNGADDDGDGDTDCEDADCADATACQSDPEVCDNGTDDDGDGATDCADSDCAGDAACVEVCDDGADNDNDGTTDCLDSDCDGDAACPGCIADGNFSNNPMDCCNGDPDQNLTCGDQGGMCLSPGETCDPAQTGECCTDPCRDLGPVALCCAPDGFDYTQLQAADAQACCTGDPNGDGICGGTAVAEDCTNATDDDGDGAVDCSDADCASAPVCADFEDCTNGVDDNGNGSLDCADAACDGDPACCIQDGGQSANPMDCCNGDPDNNFVCGDQGGMCTGPLQQCDPAAMPTECCVETCKPNPPGFPAGGFCCVADGNDYSMAGSDAVCCTADADGNGLCGEQVGGEQCTNGTDDDGDGLTDCDDADCASSPDCAPCTPDGEFTFNPMECCNGDPDNNFQCGDQAGMCVPDGQFTINPMDCCNGDPDGNFRCGDQGGGAMENCSNMVDDDGDGDVDCADSDCANTPGCGGMCLADGEFTINPADCCNGDPDNNFQCGDQGGGMENCSNMIDDDGDGDVDCADSDCANTPGCGGMCLADGEFTFDPSQCCNGDPDNNFQCGSQTNMCSQPGESCAMGAACCPGSSCVNGNQIGIPGRFCCFGAGFDYANDPVFSDAGACCSGDNDNDGLCD